jgi:uncharacterized protein (TIGR02145 family)
MEKEGHAVRCIRATGSTCFDPDLDDVCAENEVSGCTHNLATNYNPDATEEDGTCVYPGPAECGYQSVVTYDNDVYELIVIGTQCWFKENLRSDHYRNGDAILGNLSDAQWAQVTSGAQAVYNNDPANLATYGRLYNWYATVDARGLCPAGWHVPGAGDWTILASAFWGLNEAGVALKSSMIDTPPWDGTNSSGFSGEPGGIRNDGNGSSTNLGTYGAWWSATPALPFGTNAIAFGMYSGNPALNEFAGNLREGHSVRCVRDE